MRLPKMSKETSLLYSARSRKWEGGIEAVLLLHGWGGTTDHLEYLGEQLNKAGYTVYAPRLPGHGTNAKDFVNTTAEMWVRAVFESYQEIRLHHEKIFVAGQSMGGLLTILLASEFQIPKIVLFAPALIPKSRLIHLTPILKHFIAKQKTDIEFKEEDDDEKIHWKKEYGQYNYSKAGAELLRLVKVSRKKLSRLKSDVLAICSEADNSVSPKTLDLIKKNIKGHDVQTELLKESRHTITCGEEKEFVAKRTIEFLKGN